MTNGSTVIRYDFFVMIVAIVPSMTGCLMYPHVGTGPVIGATLRGSAVLGWEAGGGPGSFIRANIGGSYRLPISKRRIATSPSSTLYSKNQLKGMTTEYVHYLVYEPGVIGGGTLGIAYSDQIGFGGAYGLWAGFPFLLNESSTDDHTLDIFNSVMEGDWKPGFTITVGWRYMAGEHEICFMPKLFYAFIPSLSLSS
jgi:hypothetical protein